MYSTYSYSYVHDGIAAGSAAAIGIGLFFFLLSAVIYFLPTIIAFKRKISQRNAVLVINLLLGWTFFGWVVALVMAVWNAVPSNKTVI